MSDAGEASSAPRASKRASAFRTIGEVAEDLDLPAHVLRFWETKFPQLKPLKRGGGRRYYRPEDIVLLRRIRQCLYQDGYTIRGVQKLLGESPTLDIEPAEAAAPDEAVSAATIAPTLLPEEATLFPLEPLPAPLPELAERAIPRRAARQLGPETRAALEDLRRELLEIRALISQLGRDEGA